MPTTNQYTRLKRGDGWGVRIVGTPDETPEVGAVVTVPVERKDGTTKPETVKIVWVGDATHEAGAPVTGKLCALGMRTEQDEDTSTVWPEATATYKQLRGGKWGLKLRGARVPGIGDTAKFEVNRKDGTTSYERATVIWVGDDDETPGQRIALASIYSIT